jgi:mono/diheme cytochrome c family protein
MKLISMLAVLAAAVACLGGCERDRMSERGFSLPEGDPVVGRETFIYMQCHQCHSIEGETFPALPGLDPPYVQLGGPVTRVKSYGELVTAIINPSHKLASGYAEQLVSEGGESNMYIYNQYMTIQELVDLVMFLQPHYDVVVPRYDYRIYP